MPSSGVSLLQMPEIPMKHILEHLEFPSILVLRKVCRDLRNFIDDTKPASRFTRFGISAYEETISWELSQAQNKICIYYKKCNEGCCVKYQENEEIKKTILEDEDFVNVFCKDFHIILSHQKTVLEEFRICFKLPHLTVKEKVLESVNKSFKSMNHPLQVKSLSMIVSDHDEVLSILPYMVPKLLELIHIEALGLENNFLNLDEIEQLEQWKQAKKLSIEYFEISDVAQYFKHFSSIDLGYRDISIEELILLKEMFFASSTLTAMEILTDPYSSADVRPRLIETFGQPFLDNNQNPFVNRDSKWFFRIPNTNQFLRIKLNSIDIHFNRIKQSDVPQNAQISN